MNIHTTEPDPLVLIQNMRTTGSVPVVCLCRLFVIINDVLYFRILKGKYCFKKKACVRGSLEIKCTPDFGGLLRTL